jgi:hypothetical protein
MIQRTKKRTLFFLGLLIAGLASVVGSHVRSNYSREGSLLATIFAPEAHADTTTFAGGVEVGGDGCGGCSGGDSGY